MEEFVQVGHTKKAHGVNGELKASIDEVYIEDFAKAKAVFLKIRGQYLPYFVKNIRGTTVPIIQFDEVDNPQDAKLLAGKEIYLRESEILADEERELLVEEEEELTYNYLTGYTVFDEEAGKIGLIEEVVEMPQQEMAIVNFKGKSLMIPLNDDLIIAISEKEKTVTMSLPAGLLDL